MKNQAVDSHLVIYTLTRFVDGQPNRKYIMHPRPASHRSTKHLQVRLLVQKCRRAIWELMGTGPVALPREVTLVGGALTAALVRSHGARVVVEEGVVSVGAIFFQWVDAVLGKWVQWPQEVEGGAVLDSEIWEDGACLLQWRTLA